MTNDTFRPRRFAARLGLALPLVLLGAGGGAWPATGLAGDGIRPVTGSTGDTVRPVTGSTGDAVRAVTGSAGDAIRPVTGSAGDGAPPSPLSKAHHQDTAGHPAHPARPQTPAIAPAGTRGNGTGSGADLAQLLELARRRNPGLAAAALEAEAAAARVRGADSLPDPQFTLRLEDIQRALPGYGPGTDIRTYKLGVTQTFPLFGKLSLARERAEAAQREAEHKSADAELELLAKVKSVYAEYHGNHLATDVTRRLLGSLGTFETIARNQYAQGVVQQSDVLAAGIERAEATNRLRRLQAERRQLQARLNALVGRPANTALVEAPHTRPLPSPDRLRPERLLAQAKAANPLLRAADAAVDGAERARTLADRGWYPDVDLGVGVVRKEGRWESYEAMVGLNIPLQWELRRGRQQEAAAMTGAAQAKRAEAELTLERDLTEALEALAAARAVAGVLAGTTLPQARASLETALKGYEVGVVAFTTVLEAVRTLDRAEIERIMVMFEQQIRLAEIERLVGGTL